MTTQIRTLTVLAANEIHSDEVHNSFYSGFLVTKSGILEKKYQVKKEQTKRPKKNEQQIKRPEK